MPTYNENFAMMLRSTRLKRKLSQRQVAENLNISLSAYAYYEAGKAVPGLKQIKELKEVLHLPLRAFLHPERYIHKRALRKKAAQAMSDTKSQK